MGLKIIVTAEALDDMDAGRNFYERQESGLGDYFGRVVLAELESLKFYAGVHPQRKCGLYRMLIHRFPFSVHYRIKGEEVWVTSVTDCRQDPARTGRRLRPARTKRPRP